MRVDAEADAAFLGPSLAADLGRRAGVRPSAAPRSVLFQPDLSGLAVISEGVPERAVAVDAGGCRSALALAPAADGYQLVAVPLAAAEAGRDLTRPVASMDGGAVEPLGGALSVDDLTRWQAFALALTCADLVGTMRGATELACGYAKIRHQYGVPIGSFQSLQHLLADAYVATEGSTSVARYAAWAADNLAAEEALTAAAVAKAYCARAGRAVCESAIQVHGGIGNTWDCLAHVYLRRALLSIQLLGDAGVNLARVMRHHGIGGVHSGLR